MKHRIVSILLLTALATLPATGAEKLTVKSPNPQPAEPLKIVWGPYLQNLTPRSVTLVDRKSVV